MANTLESLIKHLDKFSDDIANNSGLTKELAVMNKKIVNEIFESQGGKYGTEPWPKLDSKLIGKKRYDSNGVSVGRYTAASLPLQASGHFKRSYVTLALAEDNMRFGSNFSNNMEYNLINAGRGDRQPMPDIDSAEYNEAVDRITDEHVNKLITEAFNADN